MKYLQSWKIPNHFIRLPILFTMILGLSVAGLQAQRASPSQESQVDPADPLFVEKSALLRAELTDNAPARVTFARSVAAQRIEATPKGLSIFWLQFITAVWAWPMLIGSMENRMDALLAEGSNVTLDEL